jgi:hypothetical protein
MDRFAGRASCDSAKSLKITRGAQITCPSLKPDFRDVLLPPNEQSQE